MLPVSGEGMNNLAMPEGAQIPLMERPLVDFRSVSPGYLRALAFPCSMAAFLRNATAAVKWRCCRCRRRAGCGRRAERWARSFIWATINRRRSKSSVILGDVHGVSLQAPPNPTVYLPYWTRQCRPQISVVARTGGDPRAVAAAIRSEIRALDPELPVPQFLSMEEIVDNSVSQRRFQLRLILLFGVASVLLSTMGVYGVVAFAVSQRTNEMGLRMVLGAKASDVQAMVWRQGMKPVAVGIGAGLIASLAISRLLTESSVRCARGRPGDSWIGGRDPGGGYRRGMLHSGVTGYARRSGDRDAVRMMDYRESAVRTADSAIVVIICGR